jgi:hypothetical protein
MFEIKGGPFARKTGVIKRERPALGGAFVAAAS